MRLGVFCSLTFWKPKFGTVAPAVERWPEEPSVGGSSPPRPTQIWLFLSKN